MTKYERIIESREIVSAIQKYAYSRKSFYFCGIHADDIAHGYTEKSREILGVFDFVVDDEDGINIKNRLSSFLASAHSGKWCASIIHTTNADYPVYSYRGEFHFETGEEVLCEGCDWNSFCIDVIDKTGIGLPLRKYMRFFKLSDFEQIAGLDAAHVRGMCQVTKHEIFKKGWRAYTAILDVM